MNLSRSVLSELALLGDVRDSASPDVSVTMSDLVAEMSRSLPSFVGLTVLAGDPETPVEITTVDDAEQVSRIRTSLRFPLHRERPDEQQTIASGVLIIYAAVPGALVDLAADLAWLTGRPLGDGRLDEDLAPSVTSAARSVSRLSTVNQAVGVLVGGGLTVEEAIVELDGRAVRTGTQRHLVAAELLASLPGFDLGPGGERS